MHHFVAIGDFKLELQSGNAQFGSNSTIFRGVWPWNLTDDLENDRAPLQCYFKLCASFRGHRWFQTGHTVRKRPIWVKIDDFVSRVTLQFDVWPKKKTIVHLFCYTLSFVHHFVAIGVSKLELRVRKRPIWVKFDDFYSRVTLKFDRWPWKTIGHLFNATSSFVHHFVAIGEFKLELQSGNAQSGSNSTIFIAVWPWNLMDHLEKTIGHLF